VGDEDATLIKKKKRGLVMGIAQVGKHAPSFVMDAVLADGQTFGRVQLSDYAGKWLVLFFYPLDFTFVCPTEIKALSAAYDEFSALGCDIVGVSTDSVHSHRAWIHAADNGLGLLRFPLASDIHKCVARDYGVLIEEEGIAQRGLFLIDPQGVLKYVVVTHLDVGRSVEETMRVLQALQSGGLCPINWKPGISHLVAK
jgi:peroxiredoxin (alkyl hydroperoxide reductase subunit C)